MRALLIGGIGYVGGRLAAHLKAQGHHVTVTTRRSQDSIPSWLQADDVISAKDFHFPSSVFQGKDIVFHLAAPDEIAAERDPLEALKAGSEVTWSTLQSLVSSGSSLPPFIYLSTFHVYGKSAKGDVDETVLPYPVHPYGLGRYLGECVVQAFRERHKIRALCVRMSNSFGVAAGYDVPRWTLIFNDLCRQVVKNKQMVLKTPGLQERNFITLHDAARGLEFLAQRTSQWPADGVIHLGSQNQFSVLKVAEMIAESHRELWGTTPTIVKPVPKPNDQPTPFVFLSKRLAALGFTWENPVRQEIQATLELCQKNLHAAGTSI